MASPITPFVGVKAFMGMPIEQLEINRSPVESIFHFITVFNQSSREGAHQIGLNRDALRQNLTFAGLQAGKGLQLAATGFNYLLTVLQNMQAGNNQNASLQHGHQKGKQNIIILLIISKKGVKPVGGVSCLIIFKALIRFACRTNYDFN